MLRESRRVRVWRRRVVFAPFKVKRFFLSFVEVRTRYCAPASVVREFADMKTPNANRKAPLFAAILAGGRGERFWPVGRRSRPKQFVDLFGGKPLIAHATDRLRGLVPTSRILVVTSADLVPATRAALPSLAPEQVLGEPEGRDTAAACALATAWVRAKAGESAVVAILTADHLMADAVGFRETLASAASVAAARPVMALVGIKPTHPATGYGYVELGAPFSGPGLPKGFRKVRRFVEKPNLGTAAVYVKSGRFVWNSGMFVWRVSVFEDALRRFRPALSEAMGRLAPLFASPRAVRAALKREYSALEKISVDYAVMEKADNLVAVRGDFGWDDVGAWTSAGEHFPKDASGNAVHGAAQLLAATGNVVANTQRGHLVAVMGASDLVVVHTPDATLVCTREAAPGLKALVAQIGADPATAHFVE